jgi:branched-chain amino acid transport system permease protein
VSLGLLLVQTLNGLELGVLLFLIAAGLTLVFGIMDVVNLAHGVLYMLGAYFAVSFAGWTGSFWAALPLAALAALTLGAVLGRLVFRRLARAGHLEQVLGTFGLILLAEEGVRLLWGPAPLDLPLPAALAGTVPLFGGLRYAVYRLAVLALGLAIAGLLWFVIERTRTGMRLRAGASNPAMLEALGVDVGRLFALVLASGAMLAGFAGAIAAPLVSVDPGMGGPVLILAFVVIVLGGLGSVAGAFAAALLVGLTDTLGRAALDAALLAGLGPSAASMAGPALASMLVYVMMALVVAFRPQGLLPARGAAALAAFALLAAAPLAAWLAGNDYLTALATRAAVLGAAAVSLQVLVGYAGLPSLGHAAFLGIGGYALLVMGSFGRDEAVLSLPVAGLAGALFAWPTGWLALRTQGVAFLMITLAFGQMAYFVASALAAYGGSDGMPLDRAPPLFGSALLARPWALLVLALAVLLGFVLAARRLGASRFGRVLRAAREAPAKVAAFGFDVGRVRLAAYVLAGAAGAIAGWLLAAASGFVSPALLDWRLAAELLVMVVLGGTATPEGAAVGGVALVLAEEGLASVTEHGRLVLGAVVLGVALLRPRRAA